MITLSDQFDRISARLFTFSGIAFCLKVLPITQVTVSDVNFSLEKKAIAVGLLAAATAYLAASSVVVFIRDLIQQKLADSLQSDEKLDLNAISEKSETEYENNVERYHNIYFSFAWISIVVEAVFPVLFGLFVVAVCIPDIGEFFNHAYATIRGQ